MKNAQSLGILLTVSDAARLAEVSSATIRLWVDRGKLPCVKTPRGVRLIRLADLEDFLDARVHHAN